jgi:excisionase family DNA binding protein
VTPLPPSERLALTVDLFTLEEVASELRTSLRSVQRLVKQGRIRTVYPTPGRRRVERRELEAYRAAIRRVA